MSRADLEFEAMGTHCHILVDVDGTSPDDLLALARLRVGLLEQCWSRFRPDSELSRLNERAGRGPIEVSDDLLVLVTHMRDAWERTDGLFDPTVLGAMRALGYDADFAQVTARPATSWHEVALTAVPGMAGVQVDATEQTVTLPAGVGLDPGAIGKGLAADIVVDELSSASVRGVLVNLGGDLSVAGRTDEPWSIDVTDERLPAVDADRRLRTIRLPIGQHRWGVATSTTLKRRWAYGRRHHVVDPRTGRPSAGDIAQVTVIATRAVLAEVTATAALLLPSSSAHAWLRRQGVDGTVLTATAEVRPEHDLVEVDHG